MISDYYANNIISNFYFCFHTIKIYMNCFKYLVLGGLKISTYYLFFVIEAMPMGFKGAQPPYSGVRGPLPLLCLLSCTQVAKC